MEDVNAMWEVNSDPEVVKYTGETVTNLEDIRDRIKNNVLGDYAKYGFGRFALVWKENKEVIGFTGLKYLEEHKAVDLGYRMKKSFWGKGIATESSRPCLEYGFGELGLDRIIALSMEENIASIRVMEKLGFKFEANIIDSLGPAVQYILLKEDFLQG